MSTIPALQQGERLWREEFHRRYVAMPHIKKAELIEGVVYIPSPLISQQHGQQRFDAIHWLGTYELILVDHPENTAGR